MREYIERCRIITYFRVVMLCYCYTSISPVKVGTMPPNISTLAKGKREGSKNRAGRFHFTIGELLVKIC